MIRCGCENHNPPLSVKGMRYEKKAHGMLSAMKENLKSVQRRAVQFSSIPS